MTRTEKIARDVRSGGWKAKPAGRKRQPQNQRLVVKVYLSGPSRCLQVVPQRVGRIPPFWQGTPTAADIRKMAGATMRYFYARYNGERYLLDGYAPEPNG